MSEIKYLVTNVTILTKTFVVIDFPLFPKIKRREIISSFITICKNPLFIFNVKYPFH